MIVRRAAFRHPAGEPSPRTAILLPGFKRQANTKAFVPSGSNYRWLEKLQEYRPNSLAGSLGQLLFLASLRIAGLPKLETLNHSLVVTFHTEQPWLTAEDRDELWSAFGVPLYEQIYCTSGLLATECIAHDGLHPAKDADWTASDNGELWFREPAAWWEDRGEAYAPSGLFGSVETETCECGQAGPRLRIAGPAQRQTLLRTRSFGSWAQVA
jgi:hypothetical protein